MESVPCPISNSMEFIPWLILPDRFDHSRELRWQLVQSCASGLVMLNPRPESSEIASHYRSAHYDPFLHRGNVKSIRNRAYLFARSLLLHYRSRLVLHGWTEPPERLSILEIGSSTGELLNFFHCHKGVPLACLAGVEPDAASAAHSTKRFGLKVSTSVHELEGEFDRIVLWHTLEHIHDLHETLHAVSRRLKPDGLVLIALPNPACSGASHYQESWIAWDAPRHLYHFMPGTLAKLLEPHGLMLCRVISYWPDALYNALYSEQLCCEMGERPFTLLRQCSALFRGVMEALTGMAIPGKGAGVLYCASLRPRAFSS